MDFEDDDLNLTFSKLKPVEVEVELFGNVMISEPKLISIQVINKYSKSLINRGDENWIGFFQKNEVSVNKLISISFDGFDDH